MDNKFIINNIHTIGDCIAIPFFAIMIYYFNNKKYKTNFEKLLYLFSIVGLIADLLFIILKITKNSLILNIDLYADIIAIPFFGILTCYFYQLKNKSILEKILFLFVFSTFFIDIFFTYLYFKN